jgi:L-cystine uptake protein TcyP (sodium:dicarboxylate symporter family)
VVAKPKPTLTTKPQIAKAIAPVIPVSGLAGAKSSGGDTLASLVVLTALALAMVCFALATLPSELVRWRHAAILVSERRVDLTLVGFTLLAAVTVFFWIGGS